MYFDDLVRELTSLDCVTAIALGGSRATGDHDERSDYDLYLYVSSVPDESVRRSILERYCSYIELGNSFWELEDDCTLKNGVDIDILYRDPAAFIRTVASVVEEHHAGTGYTTCMWYNLINCRILFDRTGVLTAARQRFSVPYPDPLRAAIITKNLRLLHGYLPSYDVQLKKAASRGDLVSVNHRSAAFMESYFDILFALNRLPHPGEKRQLQYLKSHASILPEHIEGDISHFFSLLFTDTPKAIELQRRLYDELLVLLTAEGVIS